MIPTRRLIKWLGALLVVIVIPTIINLMTAGTTVTVQQAIRSAATAQIELLGWQLAVVALPILGVALFLNHMIDARNRSIMRLNAQLYDKDQTISTLEYHLHDATQQRFRDRVTGIWNEAKWSEDVEALSSTVTAESPYTVALIDLVDFGSLNDEVGYQKVDDILKYLARTLDSSIRKREGFYKRHLVDNALLPERLYRKYPGGDEFYIVIKGTEADMLGLLTRLQRQITSEIDPYVSEKIAKIRPLRFAGAVCSFERHDKPAHLTSRLIDCLRPTRYKGATTRLLWESGRRSTDFAADDPKRRLYEQAEAVFSTAKS